MTETAIRSILDLDEIWETELDFVTPDPTDEDFGLIPSQVKPPTRAANRHARRVAKQRRRACRTIANERVQKAVRAFYSLPDIWVDNARIAKSGLTFSQFTEHVVSARG